MTKHLALIPRSLRGTPVSKLASAHNSSRKRMIRYLDSLPHYQRANPRWESYAFAFNVKLHSINLDCDHLFDLATKPGDGVISLSMVAPPRVEEISRQFREKFQELEAVSFPLFAHATEIARETLQSSLIWPGEDKPLDCCVKFTGRSGGWMALTSAGGFNVDHDKGTVIEDLMRTYGTGEYPRTWGYEVSTEEVELVFKAAVLLDIAHQQRYERVESIAARIVAERAGLA